jgi:hypothetical protein
VNCLRHTRSATIAERLALVPSAGSRARGRLLAREERSRVRAETFEPDLAAAQLLPTMDRVGAIGQKRASYLENLEPAVGLEPTTC